MQKYQNNVQTLDGRAIVGASVTVTEFPGGAPATVYNSNGSGVITQPILTNGDGEFAFYAANGRYQLQITGGGISVAQTITDIVLFDPADGIPSDELTFDQDLPGAISRDVQGKLQENVTVFDFMTEAQIADVQSATPSLDHTAAIDAALASGAKRVRAPAGRYRYSGNGINVPQGVIFEGDGVDYWDTFRPDPTNFPRKDVAGTHIYFVGTGAKVQSIENLSNYHTPKTAGGFTFPFTDFTNNDSSAGAPATVKAFSAGAILNKDSQLHNMRLLPSFNLISGYNDAALLTLADDWDVGVWLKAANDCVVSNVQAVGYWRMAAWLMTENDGTFTQLGNAERVNLTKCFGQGRRGLLIRNSPQIPVISNTANTVTLAYNASSRITASGSFKIQGSSSVYTFSGYTIVGPDLQLTGVSPALPGGLTVIRYPNTRNGVSATCFNDCLFASLDHTSGQPSSFFGIGEACAFEGDGFPLRAIAFKNTKFQTTYDHGTAIFGDVRDWKFDTACQWENGAVIAYSNTEGPDFTENLRMDGEIGGTADLTQFNPREAWLPQLSFPTQFTDGTLIMQPWKSGQAINIKDYAGNICYEQRSDNTVNLRNGANFQYLQSLGTNNDITISGNNFVFRNTSSTTIATFFGGSQNTTWTGNLSPAVDASKSLGSASFRWANVFGSVGAFNNLTGTNTNNNATAGSVGEYSTATSGTVALTTATATNVTSVSLTAGDWDVTGNVLFSPQAGDTMTAGTVSVSSTSATQASAPEATSLGTISVASGATVSGGALTRRFSLSATTTVFLVATATHAGGTLNSQGIIRARRVR